MLTMVADSGPQSFRDLVRNHNRFRFLVGPLQWTSYHLDLAGCRFEDVATPLSLSRLSLQIILITRRVHDIVFTGMKLTILKSWLLVRNLR